MLRPRRVLAAVAHPDDESFGLGAVLGAFAQSGSFTALLCFTHGEASTLSADACDLDAARPRELDDAARVLGVHQVRLLDYGDGQLGAVDFDALRGDVIAMIEQVDAELLLVFDEGGITGHPDHRRATEAALAAARTRDLPVVAWALPEEIARDLNVEFGTSFNGRAACELDVWLTVDRGLQRQAIVQHRSQSADNPILWRRLELLGDREALRLLSSGAWRI
jgi:LmbE family N-acetylglucosaminyl deacetylase